VCTPHQLLEDMRSFLEVRRGRQLQSSTFPEAILNGTQLDLNALYRAVCSRGGYAMGTGVNWAGQVCDSLCIHSPFHLTIALLTSLAKLARVQAVQRVAAIMPSGIGVPCLSITLWYHSCKRTNLCIVHFGQRLCSSFLSFF